MTMTDEFAFANQVEQLDLKQIRLNAAAQTLYDALKALANEATAARSMGLVSIIGVTNDRCLQRRIDAARCAIAKADGR